MAKDEPSTTTSGSPSRPTTPSGSPSSSAPAAGSIALPRSQAQPRPHRQPVEGPSSTASSPTPRRPRRAPGGRPGHGLRRLRDQVPQRPDRSTRPYAGQQRNHARIRPRLPARPPDDSDFQPPSAHPRPTAEQFGQGRRRPFEPACARSTNASKPLNAGYATWRNKGDEPSRVPESRYGGSHVDPGFAFSPSRLRRERLEETARGFRSRQRTPPRVVGAPGTEKPTFGATKVAVARARTATPSGSPRSASRPEGRSNARVGLPERLIAVITVLRVPSTGLVNPVPSKASTTQSASAIRASSRWDSGSLDSPIPRIFARCRIGPGSHTGWPHRLEAGRPGRTRRPGPKRCKRRGGATTPPSPPLLPGPQRIRTRVEGPQLGLEAKPPRSDQRSPSTPTSAASTPRRPEHPGSGPPRCQRPDRHRSPLSSSPQAECPATLTTGGSPFHNRAKPAISRSLEPPSHAYLRISLRTLQPRL